VFASPYFATNFAPLAVAAAYLIFRRLSVLGKPHKLLTALFVLPFLWFGVSQTFPMFGKGLAVYSSEDQEALVQFLQENGKRTNDLYVLADGHAELYVLTRRMNPTPYDYHYYSRGSDGSDIVAALKRHQVRYIVLEPERAFFIPIQPTLRQHVQTHYQPVARYGKFLVLERQGRKKS
jgi:hypothetical protein